MGQIVNLPGTAAISTVAPKTLQTTFLTWLNADWAVALQNRWLGKVTLDNGSGANQNYAEPTLPSNNVLDVTVSKRFDRSDDSSIETFVTVSNVLNERAPLSPRGTAGLPGLFYPTEQYHDDMGRYFTAGIRLSF